MSQQNWQVLLAALICRMREEEDSKMTNRFYGLAGQGSGD